MASGFAMAISSFVDLIRPQKLYARIHSSAGSPMESHISPYTNGVTVRRPLPDVVRKFQHSASFRRDSAALCHNAAAGISSAGPQAQKCMPSFAQTTMREFATLFRASPKKVSLRPSHCRTPRARSAYPPASASGGSHPSARSTRARRNILQAPPPRPDCIRGTRCRRHAAENLRRVGKGFLLPPSARTPDQEKKVTPILKQYVT